MTSHDCSRNRLHTVTTGAMFVLSGLALWAGARGWYDFRLEHAWVWWPLGFLFPAAHNLTAPPPQRNVFAGLAWLGAAGALLAANLGYVHLRLGNTLAVIFLVAGARLLYGAWIRRRPS